MSSGCKDYDRKGYCLRGKSCPLKHGDDLIELDVSGYDGLIEAIEITSAQAAAKAKEQQNELERKQADLINNLISQQRVLIKKIELCTDEAEKARLKTTLDEMSQKTKDWIEQGSAARDKKKTQ